MYADENQVKINIPSSFYDLEIQDQNSRLQQGSGGCKQHRAKLSLELFAVRRKQSLGLSAAD